ncbi:dihydrolipoyllysine-residue acetyltransferase component 4 of pyruvate dehydrogenase complex, chloroplastic-like [Cucurbita moschata]|uniref:Dihydrolipoamide acetyltransferase component of pyruvate dehydrogenase complex n=1 Tax=Cucurbita moschata TaxID=3662 RepID=A0A6J1G0K0_CUCMO|nr:dihydrolipoyllysine-residue acetyltransferase component 4 of pyruvate dehydrogenase complex, chloroplastic-like [Cucurbita moschata]XP_022945308.1 dihydrolipoyllysine-residue acetyltransferase component 4 of pyruvate dehydrogenase complex, chloroplastic-like [Cucurbita moschata]XP_022945309.1 dihydrolipoyllysine-residue acetyltransferase component 4 of pyruvate dehydrogenase complex, chloroplastic-like [Cucurbita moschata]
MASSFISRAVVSSNTTTTTIPFSFSSSVSSPLPWRSSRSCTFFPTNSCRRIPVVQCKIREIFMPALSSTMTEGKIVSWIKSEGDVLSKGESVVVVESDKADMDVETFYDGILAAIVVGEGETAPVGASIGLLAETEEEVAEAKAKAASKSQPSTPAADVSPSPPVISQPSPPPTKPASDGPRKIVATPQAKKLAKQHKVNIGSITGSGPFGRITPADVEAAAGIAPSKPVVSNVASPAASETAPVAASTPSKATAAPSNLPPPVPGSTTVPFTTMQAAVSKNMVESLSVPTFRVGYPVSTDALDALYEKVKPKGVTMTALLAKAAAMALAQHPVVNASCKDGKSFTYNDNINIAVAVAINGGLITPVLQAADKLDLYLLSQKWKELVEKARSKQLQPHEYNSGTFTLSNLGMFGVDRFDAILPPGQGAIMAVGASKPTVVTDADGFFSVKSKMLVNVTADHRIVYGADLAAFLHTFAKIVENPECLTL